ncbi:MAG: transcriptional repressor [Gammaproteobacteria bacterium]|nr:transcriptional repressor [Gammaproteobacteria bacterium]
MNQLQNKIDYADRKCNQNSVRLTAKRKLILKSLLTSDKAMSAYELVDRYKDELGEVIPAMSVYRILDFLQTQQLVHKLNLANKYIACCHIDCDHAHEVPQFLICSVCQRVKEISLGKITEEELRQDVEQAGFQLVSPQLEINCVCDDCVNEAA